MMTSATWRRLHERVWMIEVRHARGSSSFLGPYRTRERARGAVLAVAREQAANPRITTLRLHEGRIEWGCRDELDLHGDPDAEGRVAGVPNER